MAKKKKTLKPVARGFATVSVPKKPVPSEQPQDVTADAGDLSEAQNSDAPTAPVDPPQTDPAALEESALQAIVEKFQDKTEKDIVRSVKVGFFLLFGHTNKSPETLISWTGNRAGTKIRSNVTYVESGSRGHGPDSRIGVGGRKVGR